MSTYNIRRVLGTAKQVLPLFQWNLLKCKKNTWSSVYVLFDDFGKTLETQDMFIYVHISFYFLQLLLISVHLCLFSSSTISLSVTIFSTCMPQCPVSWLNNTWLSVCKLWDFSYRPTGRQIQLISVKTKTPKHYTIWHVSCIASSTSYCVMFHCTPIILTNTCTFHFHLHPANPTAPLWMCCSRPQGFPKETV